MSVVRSPDHHSTWRIVTTNCSRTAVSLGCCSAAGDHASSYPLSRASDRPGIGLGASASTTSPRRVLNNDDYSGLPPAGPGIMRAVGRPLVDCSAPS